MPSRPNSGWGAGGEVRRGSWERSRAVVEWLMSDLLAGGGAQNTPIIRQARSRFTPVSAAGRAGNGSPSEAIRGHATEHLWFHGFTPSGRAIRDSPHFGTATPFNLRK